jgi:membrane-associated phospholipid phosphatase
MVIPYISYYFYLWGTYIYLAFTHKELFVIHAKANIYSCLICILVFLIYPTYVVRPEIEVTDIFTRIIHMIYSSDNPVNALPSLHVLQSALTHIAICKIPNTNKGIKNTSFIIAVMIILSTVMIKQHYILDGVVGLAIALAAANVTYSKLYYRKYTIERDTTLS